MDIRVAILDMYDNTPNQGMRCIKAYLEEHPAGFAYQVFNVRGSSEVPEVADFDIFISTGGPGNPLEGDGVWDKKYYAWLGALWAHNAADPACKKYAFFICHSFQMASHYFGLGDIAPRNSMSFGTFPVHKTADGEGEPFFSTLPDPFFVADFRRFQLINPNFQRLQAMGATILALEKIRPHVPLERAIMAIRYSDELFGTQFHPEADPDGMLLHFQEDDRKQHIIDSYGHYKYQDMIDHLNDPDKIALTHAAVVPSFLTHAAAAVSQQREQWEVLTI